MECFFLFFAYASNTCRVKKHNLEEPGGVGDETMKHKLKINPQSVNCHEQVSKYTYEPSDLYVHLKVALLATTVPQSTGPTLVNNTCDMYM